MGAVAGHTGSSRCPTSGSGSENGLDDATVAALMSGIGARDSDRVGDGADVRT